jgi:hypothetical protein
MTPRTSSSGFSLVELVVAAGVIAGMLAALLHLSIHGQRMARAQPDAADLQQRVRVAADMIQRDLMSAGAGAIDGSVPGPLVDLLPPLLPARIGIRSPAPELSWTSDQLSLLYVPAGGWGVVLASSMPDSGADLMIDTTLDGCPGSGLCGFVVGTRALIADPSSLGAGYDVFTVTGIAAGIGHGPPNPAFSKAYPAGASLLPVVQRIYYIDRPARRLMLYDGYQSDLPLVDNVVDLRFEYFGEPTPGSVVRPAGTDGNCAYAAGDPPVPLLVALGGLALRPFGPEVLSDGPVCGLPPNRFDADLLRIRRVRVTIRAQVAADDLRGAGDSFRVSGRSTGGDAYVPDYDVSFDVSPRNMIPTR